MKIAEFENYAFIEQLKLQYKLAQYTDDELVKVTTMLNKVEHEIMGQWHAMTDFGKEKAMELLEQSKAMTIAAKQTMSTSIANTIGNVSEEAAKAHSRILSFSGRAGKVATVKLSANQMAAFWQTTPVGGNLLKDWVSRSFDKNTIEKIQQEIATGFFKGETINQMIGRLKTGFGMTKHEVNTLVRTYVSTANMDALQRTFEANKDLIKDVRWRATGDANTCLVCASLDGNVFPYDKHPPIPIHPRCRCTLIPMPTSVAKLGVETSEADAAYKDAQKSGVTNSAIFKRLGSKKSVSEWIQKQPPEIQIQMMGPKRYELLSKGLIDWEDLVDLNTYRIRRLEELNGGADLKIKARQGVAEAAAKIKAKKEAKKAAAMLVKQTKAAEREAAAQAKATMLANKEALKNQENAIAAAKKAEEQAVKKALDIQNTQNKIKELKDQYFQATLSNQLDQTTKALKADAINQLEAKLISVSPISGQKLSTVSSLEKDASEFDYYKKNAQSFAKKYAQLPKDALDEKAKLIELIAKYEAKAGLTPTAYSTLEQMNQDYHAAKKAEMIAQAEAAQKAKIEEQKKQLAEDYKAANKVATFTKDKPYPEWLFEDIPDPDLTKGAGVWAPEVLPVNNKGVSTGAIIFDPATEKVFIYEPKDHFGLYQHTFPKGQLEPHLTHAENAIKEVWEETGMQAKLLDHLGSWEKSTSHSSYYVGYAEKGNPTKFGVETQAVKVVPLDELKGLLNKSVDKKIADKFINDFYAAKNYYGQGDVIKGFKAMNKQKQALYEAEQAAKKLEQAKAHANSLDKKVAALHTEQKNIDGDLFKLKIKKGMAKSDEAKAAVGQQIAELQAKKELVSTEKKTLLAEYKVAKKEAGIAQDSKSRLDVLRDQEQQIKAATSEKMKAAKAAKKAEKAAALKAEQEATKVEQGHNQPLVDKMAQAKEKFNTNLTDEAYKEYAALEQKMKEYLAKHYPDMSDEEMNLYIAGIKSGVVGQTKQDIIDTAAIKKEQWDKFKESKQETPKKAPVIEKQKAATQTINGDDFIQYKGQSGSNQGGFYQNKNNPDEKYYFKFLKSDAHIDNEILAAQLYKAAGVDGIPELTDVQMNGRRGVASKVVDGVRQDHVAITTQGSELNNAIKEHMAIDAWLGNWDAVGTGYDNLLVKDGKAYHIDVGGSLLFRAQGGAKGADFGNEVRELETFLDKYKNGYTYEVFKGVTKEQIEAGVKKVAAISDDAIRGLVKQYGPKGEAAKGLADTLIARKNYLMERYPDALKKAGLSKVKGRAPGRQTHSPAGEARPIQKIDKAFTDSAAASGFQGKSLPFDKDHIEDQNALVFTEEHEGKMRTVVKMKVRQEANQAITDAVTPYLENKMAATAATGPQPLKEDVYFDPILTAIKNITYHKGNFESVNMGKFDAAIAMKKELELLAATTKSDDAFKMAKEYLGWIEKLEKAKEEGKVVSGNMFQFKVEPKKEIIKEAKKTAAPFKATVNQVQLTRRQTLSGKMYVANDAAASEDFFPNHRSDIAQLKGRQYTVEFEDGVRVRYNTWSDDTWYAQRGDMEITAPGDITPELINKMIDKVEKLGINASLSSELDAEKMYLQKTAYILKKSKNKPWLNMLEKVKDAPIEEQVAAMRKQLSKNIGVDDVTKLPDYNPNGEYQLGFLDKEQAAGQRIQYRPDISKADLDRELPNYVLYHGITNDSSMSSFLEKVMANNGAMVSTTEKMRLGIPAGGMSPSSDMGTGGAAYTFTRIMNPASSNWARENSIILKKDLLRRADAVTYHSDKFGKTKDDFVYHNRHNDIKGLKKAAEYSSNETIFKQSVTILDNVEYFIAADTNDVKNTLNVLRQYGITELPDGRKIEDVVITSRQYKDIVNKMKG